MPLWSARSPRTLAVLGLAALLPGGLVAAPAGAAPGDVVVTAPSPVSLPSGCVELPLSYSLELPPGVTQWGLEFIVNGPDGQRFGYEVVGSHAQSPAAGTALVESCLTSRALGTYTVTTRGSYSIGSSTSFPERLSATFDNVAPAVTRTRVKARRKGEGRRSRVVVRAALSASSGGGPYLAAGAGLPLTVERLRRGAWKPVKTVPTSSTGKARVVIRTARRVKVRAVFAGYGQALGTGPQPIAGSVSKARTVTR